jgi:CHAT domain
MRPFELTLTIQDDCTVQAEREHGARTSGRLRLDDLDRRLIEIFDDWLIQDKIKSCRELATFGSLLYRTLFNGRVESFFKQQLDEAHATGQSLRLQLSFGQKVADLASLPWEYLCFPNGNSFLATHHDLVLSRYIPLEIARHESLAPTKGPLRILIVVSRPQELGAVIPDYVIQDIENLAQSISVKIDTLMTPTRENFLDKLEETKPHVLHFIGHGKFDKERKKGKIALLDDDGVSPNWVPDDEFAEDFVHMRSIPRLAFLHLCEGGSVDFSANFAGLAPQLVRAGIQAVVAMQYPISNNAATRFSQAFYKELSEGKPVDNAVQEGRWRITRKIKGALDSRVFGTPILYMYARDGIIQPPPHQ